MAKMTYKWVKKQVNKRQWNNWYVNNSSYCFLKEDSDGVWTGFLVVGGNLPDSCLECSDYEIYQIDEYRRAHRIAPTPYIKSKNKDEIQKSEVKQSTIEALDKIREQLFSSYKSPQETEGKEVDPMKIPY